MGELWRAFSGPGSSRKPPWPGSSGTLPDLIPGTWYRELFYHQMGPYQTSLAEARWTLLQMDLQMTFPMLVVSIKSPNYPNGFQNIRGVLFLRKNKPCQETAGCPPNVFFKQIVYFQVVGQTVGRVPNDKNDATPNIYRLECPKLMIPQTVFSCRGSYGVGKGALIHPPAR